VWLLLCMWLLSCWLLYLAALATNSINTYLLTYLLTHNHIKSCAGVTSATSIKINIYNARGSRTRSKQAVWEAATICHQPLQIDLWPFDLESGVRVTCDVGYLCANFSLPRPLCSWLLRPDCRDRQTSDAHHRLMPLTLGAGHNNTIIRLSL